MLLYQAQNLRRSVHFYKFFFRNVLHKKTALFYTQWAKSPKIVSLFVNSALKIQCHIVKNIVKNTLLQITFWVILPTG